MCVRVCARRERECKIDIPRERIGLCVAIYIYTHIGVCVYAKGKSHSPRKVVHYGRIVYGNVVSFQSAARMYVWLYLYIYTRMYKRRCARGTFECLFVCDGNLTRGF